MPKGYGYLLVFLVVGVLFCAIALGLAWLLRPHRPTPAKAGTYECGLEPTGVAWYQFPVRYYLFALIFVLFDVETAYLYPWAIQFAQGKHKLFALFAVGEAAIFLGILMVGFLYVWRKGALKWE